MNTEKEDIINYDFQGWPVYKMNIRDILKDLGLVLDETDNTWKISNNNPILDIYPITVVDDGMGYGVNEKFITSVSSHPEPDSQSNSRFCTIFIEEQDKDIELWNKSKFHYGSAVRDTRDTDPIEYWIMGINETPEGQLEYLCVHKEFSEISEGSCVCSNKIEKIINQNFLDWF